MSGDGYWGFGLIQPPIPITHHPTFGGNSGVASALTCWSSFHSPRLAGCPARRVLFTVGVVLFRLSAVLYHTRCHYVNAPKGGFRATSKLGASARRQPPRWRRQRAENERGGLAHVRCAIEVTHLHTRQLFRSPVARISIDAPDVQRVNVKVS